MAAAAATTTETVTNYNTAKPPRPTKKLVCCFSYAAYAKNLIRHLRSLNIPILPGLNDAEFAYIESTFNFIFPPDLRSILREGLPVGPGFPNWRSSSHQQLKILVNLPVLSLSKNVSLNNFWSGSWGQKPDEDDDDALCLIIKKLLDRAPVLVPVYRNCYVPSTPNMVGNPVFYVDTKEVRVLSFDLAGFFKETEFMKGSGVGGGGAGVTYGAVLIMTKVVLDHMPAWAAKEARRIEFWTDVAERGRMMVARYDTRGWWSDCLGLDCCLEEVFWRLRDGGWTEEEVREMMMMMDGCDDPRSRDSNSGVQLHLQLQLQLHVRLRLLSIVLLRAGWSKEDVMYSLNLQDDDEKLNGVDSVKKNMHACS